MVTKTERDGEVEQNRTTEGNPSKINGIQETRWKRWDRPKNCGCLNGAKKTSAEIVWGQRIRGIYTDRGRKGSIEGHRLNYGKTQNRRNKIITINMERTL